MVVILRGFSKLTKRLDKIFNIEGKVVVVTGAAGLLGRQHVEAIVSFGGTPILIDLNLGGLESLKSHIKEKYKNIFLDNSIKDESSLILVLSNISLSREGRFFKNVCVNSLNLL